MCNASGLEAYFGAPLWRRMSVPVAVFAVGRQRRQQQQQPERALRDATDTSRRTPRSSVSAVSVSGKMYASSPLTVPLWGSIVCEQPTRGGKRYDPRHTGTDEHMFILRQFVNVWRNTSNGHHTQYSNSCTLRKQCYPYIVYTLLQTMFYWGAPHTLASGRGSRVRAALGAKEPAGGGSGVCAVCAVHFPDMSVSAPH